MSNNYTMTPAPLTSVLPALRDSLASIGAHPSNRSKILRAFRAVMTAHGYAAPGYLGSVNGSAKVEKGEALNVATYIVYLAPSDMSGAVNTCPQASPGCRAACLVNSGRALMSDKVNAARIARTLLYAASRPHFSAVLFAEIASASRKAAGQGMTFAVRLNGTSDISPRAFRCALAPGEPVLDALDTFPRVQFYDYTKISGRVDVDYGANYSLTLSWVDGWTLSDMRSFLEYGFSVAVPFADLNAAGRIKVAKYAKLPQTFMGYPVVDGDISDARFADREYFGIPKGAGFIVGLRAKRTTKAKEAVALESGFFIETDYETKYAE